MADAEHVFGFFSDPEVMQFYDCEALTNVEEAKMLIRRYCQWFANQHGFRWGIALKPESHVIVARAVYSHGTSPGGLRRWGMSCRGSIGNAES